MQTAYSSRDMVNAYSDKGTLLGDVVSQDGLQSSLQQVSGCVVTPCPPPQPLIHTGTHLQSPTPT